MTLRSRASQWWSILSLTVLLLATLGCQTKSPEERIAEYRSQYEVELNGFIVREPEAEMAADEMAGEDEAMDPAEAEGEATDEGGEEADDEPAGDEMAGDEMAGDESPDGEMSDGEMSYGEMSYGEMSGDEMAEPMEPAGPQLRDVILDLKVFHTSPEMLPGLTLDVFHVDTQDAEKGRYLVWIDTSTLVKGHHIQVAHTLTDVEFAAGDKFAVEVRSSVPPGERSEYEEFQ